MTVLEKTLRHARALVVIGAIIPIVPPITTRARAWRRVFSSTVIIFSC